MTVKVFIVDDEPAIPKLTQIYLERIVDDFEIITAKDGAEALDLISKLPETDYPDITILDFKMADMDGVDTAKQLVEKGIRNIYILTAYVNPEIISRANECGVKGIMKKSEGFKAIAEKIAEMIRQSQTS